MKTLIILCLISFSAFALEPFNWYCTNYGVCSPDFPRHAVVMEVLNPHTGAGVDPGGRNYNIWPNGRWHTIDLTVAGVPSDVGIVCLGTRLELNNGLKDIGGEILEVMLKSDISVPDSEFDKHTWKIRTDSAEDSLRNGGHACLKATNGTIAFRWDKENWTNRAVFGYVVLWVDLYFMP